jgi:hypothetical protein
MSAYLAAWVGATEKPVDKVPTGKVPTGKVPTGKVPTGKVPTGKVKAGKAGKEPEGKVFAGKDNGKGAGNFRGAGRGAGVEPMGMKEDTDKLPGGNKPDVAGEPCGDDVGNPPRMGVG